MPLSSPTFCKFFLKADTNQHLQSETNTPPSIVAIILAFVTFLLLATFPGWHEERDARTGSDVTRGVQRLFERRADLFPIRESGGVYFGAIRSL